MHAVTGGSAHTHLSDGREREHAGCLPEAIACYETAIEAGERCGDHRTLAEALRRLAVLRHLRGDSDAARELCRRSHAVACAAGKEVLAAEALNVLGGIALETGDLHEARASFNQALDAGGQARHLRARVEQNLGIIANIEGKLDDALHHYRRSLAAYRDGGDEHGCAIAYANLGMVMADHERWAEAGDYFEQSLSIAERAGDQHLVARGLVGHAEVLLAQQLYERARQHAEAALAIFDQLGMTSAKSDAYRIIGLVYRETGRPALAESRLRSAIDLAVHGGGVLSEAEASRELAVLFQRMGRNQDALRLLNAAHRLFRRLGARRDQVNVAGRLRELKTTYLAVVREWGQSIESSDSYTYGHCERVASFAVAVARQLDSDPEYLTQIRVGAYLHDVGKVRVPHELLNKAGPLTAEEREIVERHPVWGVEMLAGIEFPWDIKPIIRWHHEKVDGTGYPDRLCGEEIPESAQIVGIVDVYDALTTARPYRPAMPHGRALEIIRESKTWWSHRVYEAFLAALPAFGTNQKSRSVSKPRHAGEPSAVRD